MKIVLYYYPVKLGSVLLISVVMKLYLIVILSNKILIQLRNIANVERYGLCNYEKSCGSVQEDYLF